jgi:predicted enzyme related to lactoylglutathione lyase
VAVLPVAYVDRAKEFYGGLAWRLDADFSFDNGFRVVQFTPPGSGASIQFGTDMTSGAPSSVQNLYLIAADIGAARDELVAHGAEVSEVFHPAAPGAQFPSDTSGHLGEHSPDSYSSFATSSDPDGNGSLLREITTRLPGRIDTAVTSFASASDWRARCGAPQPLTASTRRAPARQTRNWPDWCAEYMVAERAGTEPRCRPPRTTVNPTASEARMHLVPHRPDEPTSTSTSRSKVPGQLLQHLILGHRRHDVATR